MTKPQEKDSQKSSSKRKSSEREDPIEVKKRKGKASSTQSKDKQASKSSKDATSKTVLDSNPTPETSKTQNVRDLTAPTSTVNVVNKPIPGGGKTNNTMPPDSIAIKKKTDKIKYHEALDKKGRLEKTLKDLENRKMGINKDIDEAKSVIHEYEQKLESLKFHREFFAILSKHFTNQRIQIVAKLIDVMERNGPPIGKDHAEYLDQIVSVAVEKVFINDNEAINKNM